MNGEWSIVNKNSLVLVPEALEGPYKTVLLKTYYL